MFSVNSSVVGHGPELQHVFSGERSQISNYKGQNPLVLSLDDESGLAVPSSTTSEVNGLTRRRGKEDVPSHAIFASTSDDSCHSSITNSSHKSRHSQFT